MRNMIARLGQVVARLSIASLMLVVIACTTQETAATTLSQPISECTLDYCIPADWNTARVDTITPGVEPLNVIISARSTVPLDRILAALESLDDWNKVPTGTGIVNTCVSPVSPEQANVTGRFITQEESWRLKDCYGGGYTLALTGQENHARLWNQPVPGSKFGAWFISASYETLCISLHGKLKPYQLPDGTKRTGSPWHCIDGNPADSYNPVDSNNRPLGMSGYDSAAANLAATIVQAASKNGWRVTKQIDTRSVDQAHGGDIGENNVHFSGTVYVMTVDSMDDTASTPQPTGATGASKTVFSGVDTNSQESLWVTDGTQAGTRELTNIAGANSRGITPGDITALNGKALFSGYDTQGNFQLWVTDGTAAGTKELTTVTNSVRAGRGGLDPSHFTAFNGKILFNGYDAHGNDGLWITDGSSGGTMELATYATNITVFGKQAFFYGTFGRATLWSTDGTAAGTKELANYALFDLASFTVFGNQALFSADTDSFGDTGLWITDGTVAGTHALQKTNQPDFARGPSNITVIGNKAVFNAMDVNSLNELWVTDGTTAGTRELTTLSYGSNTGLFPVRITALNTQALFMGYDTHGKRGLWVTDGTTNGTKELVSSDINPMNFTVFGNQLLFNGNDPNAAASLWITDGTQAGTTELKTVAGDFHGLNPTYITVVGNKALFNGTDQLWITNGAAGGTTQLTTFTNSFTGGLSPDQFAVLVP